MVLVRDLLLELRGKRYCIFVSFLYSPSLWLLYNQIFQTHDKYFKPIIIFGNSQCTSDNGDCFNQCFNVLFFFTCYRSELVTCNNVSQSYLWVKCNFYIYHCKICYWDYVLILQNEIQVSIKFQVPPSCEVSHLIANLVSNLGLKVEESAGGSDMLLRAWDRYIHLYILISSFGCNYSTVDNNVQQFAILRTKDYHSFFNCFFVKHSHRRCLLPSFVFLLLIPMCYILTIAVQLLGN